MYTYICFLYKLPSSLSNTDFNNVVLEIPGWYYSSVINSPRVSTLHFHKKKNKN